MKIKKFLDSKLGVFVILISLSVLLNIFIPAEGNEIILRNLSLILIALGAVVGLIGGLVKSWNISTAALACIVFSIVLITVCY